MKLLATIFAIVTASAATADTGCFCCKHVHLSLTCCALCISEPFDLTEVQTEACSKCALYFINGDCSECTRGDNGCPVEAYNEMEKVLSELK